MTVSLAVFVLLLAVIEAQKPFKKKIGVIGVVKDEWKAGREIKIHPNVPYSFTIYGKDLPSSNYILSSRSSCFGVNNSVVDAIDIPLITVWPPQMSDKKRSSPALYLKNRFVILRADKGVPFEYDKNEKFFICHADIDQKTADLLIIRSQASRIQWWRCIAMLACLVCSAFCSGISIAFFTYSTDELISIIEASINKTEKNYAEKILWYRQKSNYLICCFSAANCIFNVLLTNLCEQIFNNFRMNLMASTLASCCLTVILGEILPQAICSRYGLIVAAKTRYITFFLFVVMIPFAWPLSKVVDLILGREAREFLSSDQLKKLLTHHANNLCEDQEGEILRRTVKFHDMTVGDIMKPLSDIFAISDSCKFTPELALNLVEHGLYSRIPVYSGKNTKSIYGCVNMNELLSKPKEGQTFEVILKETTSHLRLVPIDMSLQALSEEMKTGVHHMCLVFAFRSKRNEVVGLVTSEDVWEQLFGDIQDDLDQAFDNKRTGIRKDQATLDWYKERGLPFNCNQQLAIIQQLYNLCPELKWMGLNVHKMRNLMPRKLKTLAVQKELTCETDKIWVICNGEFEAEVVVQSDCSTSGTKLAKKFYCNTRKDGKVIILNSSLVSNVAQEYVKSFSSLSIPAPTFSGKYDLQLTRTIRVRKEISYFTIDRDHLIKVIQSLMDDEDHEYYEIHRQPILKPPSRQPKTKKITSDEEGDESEPLLKVASTQKESKEDVTTENTFLQDRTTQRSSSTTTRDL